MSIKHDIGDSLYFLHRNLSGLKKSTQVNLSKKLWTDFTKGSVLDVWQGSECTSRWWNLFFHQFLIFQNQAPWCKRRCVVTTHQSFSSLPSLWTDLKSAKAYLALQLSDFSFFVIVSLISHEAKIPRFNFFFR